MPAHLRASLGLSPPLSCNGSVCPQSGAWTLSELLESRGITYAPMCMVLHPSGWRYDPPYHDRHSARSPGRCHPRHAAIRRQAARHHCQRRTQQSRPPFSCRCVAASACREGGKAVTSFPALQLSQISHSARRGGGVALADAQRAFSSRLLRIGTLTFQHCIAAEAPSCVTRGQF